MSGQERLFDAIGGVDEALLERSEGRRVRRNNWTGWTAAALLAAALLVWAALPGNPAVGPGVSEDPPPAVENPPVDPGHEEAPAAEGQYHFLQFQVEADTPEIPFSIYIDEESYYSYEQDGLYVVRPRIQPEHTPECRLEISYMAGATLAEAVELVQARVAGEYASVEVQEEGALGFPAKSSLLSPRSLYASNGTDWDSAQREVLFADGGQGGVFVFEVSYFLEATEGHRARFLDMIGTFAVETEETEPSWMRDLRDASLRLMEAVFADELGGVQDLLAPDAWVGGYEEDVTGLVSVGGIDYSVDAGTGYRSAVVSVKHRLGAEEPYSYLTMELTRTDSRWQAGFIGLEK